MHHYLLYHKPEDDWYLNLVLGQAQRCDRVAPGTLESKVEKLESQNEF
jgi:hypothetical protein